MALGSLSSKRLTKNESPNFNEVLLAVAIPAKAAIQGGKAAAVASGPPRIFVPQTCMR
jgi:hypothetical protein